MTGILAFPPARRRDLVQRHAAWFIRRRPDVAERGLSRLLDQQRATLLRKGVEPEAVAAEIAALGSAVRAEAWALLFRRGGAA
jgi:tripartite-type tricarboxylate transporter receptor subunit TctC